MSNLEDRVTALEAVVKRLSGDAAVEAAEPIKQLPFSLTGERVVSVENAIEAGEHLHNQDARFLLHRYRALQKEAASFWKARHDALDAAEAARIDKEEAVKAHKITLEEARAVSSSQAEAYNFLERQYRVAENKCAILTQRLESDELLRQLLADAQQTWGKMLAAHQDNQKVQP